MIGQYNLRTAIDQQIKDNTFPSFSILVGPEGSGRTLVAEWIAKKLSAQLVGIGTSVDDVRVMVDNASKIKAKTLYVICDADRMSVAAKNALLKIVEEPPENTYFMITLNSTSNTLPTILSRAVLYTMDKYTQAELKNYIKSKYTPTSADIDILITVCETPRDVDNMISYGVQDFYDYVTSVVSNIAEVSGANSFKIADKIALKNETDKYDLQLFWNTFNNICLDNIVSKPGNADVVRYAHGVRCTSHYMQELKILGVNKQSLFDNWILDIRSEWMV